MFTKEDLVTIVTLTKCSDYISEFLARFGVNQPTTDKVQVLQLRAKAEAHILDLDQKEKDEAEHKAKAIA